MERSQMASVLALHAAAMSSHSDMGPLSKDRDLLCGLVVRLPGCRPRSPGFGSRHYQIFCVAVGLEWSPLGLVRINEELLQRKVAAPV
jgi:hypothetical protein